MGFAFLGSSAENRNETNTENVSSAADNGAQSLTAHDGSTVNVLDGGAISGAYDLLRTSFGKAVKTNQDVSLAGIKGVKEAYSTANKSEFEGLSQWLIGGAVVIAAAFIFKK